FEYHESIPVENLKSYFGIALRPDAYHAQMAGRLSIRFELHSAHSLRDFKMLSSIYPLKIEERNANTIRGSFQGQQVALTEDFSVQYSLAPAGDTMHVLTYRNPDSGQPNPTEISPQRSTHEPGFFEVLALLGNQASNNHKPAASGEQGFPAHNVVILFDNSLSMQWEKLERSYAALQKVLHSLGPADRFNVLLFNSKVSPFQPQMSAASRLSLQQASEFVQASKLRGGTNLQQA